MLNILCQHTYCRIIVADDAVDRYWSHNGESLLAHLKSDKSLEDQLSPAAFSVPNSPNWQDSSTQAECDSFDNVFGPEELARITGSKAHHRFTGPQIMRLRRNQLQRYKNTARISLVSSFLASIFLCKIAPIDISDACGMNLWDIPNAKWHQTLVGIAASDQDTEGLLARLGEVRQDPTGKLGNVGEYFVQKYGFDPNCWITPFTGDNPSTILCLPLRSLDAIVSLGTSTTFLMATPRYLSDPSYHLMNHPTTSGLYMFMLCYKNGGLAREAVRDRINAEHDHVDLNQLARNPWYEFERAIEKYEPLCVGPENNEKPIIGLFYDSPEIVPNVGKGTHRFVWQQDKGIVIPELDRDPRHSPSVLRDARAIVESQLMSLRLRSRQMTESTGKDLPPQPRRIYLTGGGSQNPAIQKMVGEILGGSEGVYTLDVGTNGCALGAAYRALWAYERESNESFDVMIGKRWKEETAVKKVHHGYTPDLFEVYGKGVEALQMAERYVVCQEMVMPDFPGPAGAMYSANCIRRSINETAVGSRWYDQSSRIPPLGLDGLHDGWELENGQGTSTSSYARMRLAQLRERTRGQSPPAPQRVLSSTTAEWERIRARRARSERPIDPERKLKRHAVVRLAKGIRNWWMPWKRSQ